MILSRAQWYFRVFLVALYAATTLLALSYRQFAVATLFALAMLGIAVTLHRTWMFRLHVWMVGRDESVPK